MTVDEALDAIEEVLTDVYSSSSDEEEAHFKAMLALDFLRKTPFK